MIDYVKLKQEIETDPSGLGYSGKPATIIADLLNKPISGAQILIDAEIPTWKILDAIDPTEFDDLTSADKDTLKLILSMGTVNLSSKNIRNILSKIFSNATTTTANLQKIAYKTPTRAEQLFGYGTRVTHTDVVRALRLNTTA